MTSEQFTYWLQGFVELTGTESIDSQQWKIITDHLKTVFKKETPFYKTSPNFPDIINVPYKTSPFSGQTGPIC